MNRTMRVMFDTNIFNRIVERRFDLNDLPEGVEAYVTHVQRDELEATPDDFREKRIELLKLFSGIFQERLPAESAVVGVSRVRECRVGGNFIPAESVVWDVSRWGESKWSSECESLYDQILNKLKKCDSNPNKVQSHIRDALISETAIKNGITLITEDQNLHAIVNEFGSALNISQIRKK